MPVNKDRRPASPGYDYLLPSDFRLHLPLSTHRPADTLGLQMKCTSLRTPFVGVLLLGGATLSGLVVAVLTRADKLPRNSWWVCKPFMCLLHIAILGVWTVAWLFFWKHTLEARGGWRFAISVALTAAVAAEVVQLWLPGHLCDALGVCCSLTGSAAVIVWQKWREQGSVTSG